MISQDYQIQSYNTYIQVDTNQITLQWSEFSVDATHQLGHEMKELYKSIYCSSSQ